ncbi:hypothetical protein V5O48_014126 [Marasmius crinis-equi]|uniref:Uncharacterized protein n=1 Tax=Marasmius crinis-equi TaxID=585013 RepID=A0ABR3EY75_9AGAR
MGTHLREVIVNNSRVAYEKNPQGLWYRPEAAPIEKSFEDFTDALARAFLVSRHTPRSRTAPFCEAEYDGFHNVTGVRINPPCGPSFDERKGNLLESRRMLFTSLLQWYEIAGPYLPEGVNRARLSRDILDSIIANSGTLQSDDRIRLMEGKEVFPYGRADWREVMTADLAASEWMRWIWIEGGMCRA